MNYETMTKAELIAALADRDARDEPQGNLWVNVTHAGVQVASLRIDNMLYANSCGELAALLDVRSSDLYEGRVDTETAIAALTDELVFTVERAAKKPEQSDLQKRAAQLRSARAAQRAGNGAAPENGAKLSLGAKSVSSGGAS